MDLDILLVLGDLQQDRVSIRVQIRSNSSWSRTSVIHRPTCVCRFKTWQGLARLPGTADAPPQMDVWRSSFRKHSFHTLQSKSAERSPQLLWDMMSSNLRGRFSGHLIVLLG